MKIGITTYFNIKNYGSALQAFAMRTILKQNGHSVMFLNIKERHPIHCFFHKLHVAVVTVSKCIIFKEARKTYSEIKKLRLNTSSAINPKVSDMFSKFEDEFLPSISLGRIELKRLAKTDEYGAFICGSDQIWSPLSPHLSGFKFLNFAPKRKRIAYAPSFGVSQIPTYNRNFIKKHLIEMEDISIREFDGAKLIKNLIGKNVPVLLDPTMLLTGEQWRRIYQTNTIIDNKEKYVLCYFFDEPSTEIVDKITSFAKSNNCKVKVLSCSNKTFIKNGAEYVNAGPMEFVSLIDNAQYIFTNSFHGCVFSVLFSKRFIAFGRNHSKTVKQTSRIATLLNEVKSQDSFYKEGQIEFSFPNVERFDSCLEPLRTASIEYLLNCLKKRSV